MVMGRRGRVHGGYGKFVEKDLCLVESCLPVSFVIRELLRVSLFSWLSLSGLFNDRS